SVTFNFKYGASDIIQNEYNGLIVTQDNQNAFTEAITKLISNSHLRKELGIHALETGDKYDKSNILKKWEDILTTIQHQLIL
ncbi:MAG: glycosyltransferase, partial [Segatella copri]